MKEIYRRDKGPAMFGCIRPMWGDLASNPLFSCNRSMQQDFLEPWKGDIGEIKFPVEDLIELYYSISGSH